MLASCLRKEIAQQERFKRGLIHLSLASTRLLHQIDNCNNKNPTSYSYSYDSVELEERETKEEALLEAREQRIHAKKKKSELLCGRKYSSLHFASSAGACARARFSAKPIEKGNFISLALGDTCYLFRRGFSIASISISRSAHQSKKHPQQHSPSHSQPQTHPQRHPQSQSQPQQSSLLSFPAVKANKLKVSSKDSVETAINEQDSWEKAPLGTAAAAEAISEETIAESPEIKDPSMIFQSVWSKLENELGIGNLTFPKEIIWLNGAPGSGKGTNTPFILTARGISSEPIVMSDLLRSPELKKIMDSGEMISDKLVIEVVFRKLLEPQYRLGAVVDGFPRSAVQVECLKLLYDKMMALRKQFLNSEVGHLFPRPIFRIAILYVSEKESLERQLKRGLKVREQNQRVKESGYGTLSEERVTDFDEKLICRRYEIFKNHYDTLLALREHFPFYIINAQASIDNVQQSILKQFEYQSSLELNQETYDVLQQLPLATQIAINARQELVRRLDNYQQQHYEAFMDTIKVIETEFLPVVRRMAFSGTVLIRSENPVFSDPLMVDMALDIMAERGFVVQFDAKVHERPVRVDPHTHHIFVSTQTTYNFVIKFPGAKLRLPSSSLTEQS